MKQLTNKSKTSILKYQLKPLSMCRQFTRVIQRRLICWKNDIHVSGGSTIQKFGRAPHSVQFFFILCIFQEDFVE